MTIGIIGVGLIGGSIALTLKAQEFADHVIGIDQNATHLDQTLARGLIDEKSTLENGLATADLLIVAIPVDASEQLIPKLLNSIKPSQTIMDVGSTKSGLINVINSHPQRGRFVATHPMAGTEYSGPQAAKADVFTGKCAVICDADNSHPDALALVKSIYAVLKMNVIELEAEAHDKQVAYVSHLPHISSFALAATVLNKAQEERHIFDLASAGFRSSVRLAKSSPEMWTPIIQQNRQNIQQVLKELILQLTHFEQLLALEDYDQIFQFITTSNRIKHLID